DVPVEQDPHLHVTRVAAWALEVHEAGLARVALARVLRLAQAVLLALAVDAVEALAVVRDVAAKRGAHRRQLGAEVLVHAHAAEGLERGPQRIRARRALAARDGFLEQLARTHQALLRIGRASVGQGMPQKGQRAGERTTAA